LLRSMRESAAMVMPTCMDRSTQAAAVVEKPEKGRALIVFRSEEEAEKYRSDTGKHPASDGWGPAALDLEDLANVLEMHDCTHVAMLEEWIGGKGGVDFSSRPLPLSGCSRRAPA
jgi:hypothetical protein